MEAKIVTPNTGSLPLPGQGALIPSQVQTGANVKVTPPKETLGNNISQQNQERDRLEAVKLAAQSFNYPLGDKKFTIYKDKQGQYITRFTSLVDGSVTYFPEPELLGKGKAGTLVEFIV